MFDAFVVDFSLHPWNAWKHKQFFVFVSLFFSIVLCKDSWEDFTELVEQMQMLDEFKGAYRGIASSLHSHLLRHHLKAVWRSHQDLLQSVISSISSEHRSARLPSSLSSHWPSLSQLFTVSHSVSLVFSSLYRWACFSLSVFSDPASLSATSHSLWLIFFFLALAWCSRHFTLTIIP